MRNLALASVPTGTPRSPLFGADTKKFSHPLVRFIEQKPTPLTRRQKAGVVGLYSPEPPAKRLSYHTDYSKLPANNVNRSVTPSRPRSHGRASAGRVLSRINAGTSSSPSRLLFTLGCQEEPRRAFVTRCQRTSQFNLVFGSARTATTAVMRPTAPCRCFDQGALRRTHDRPSLQRHAAEPAENEGFGRTSRLCISTMPTTAPKATAR